MDFGNFLFWIGFSITIGMAVAFGALVGVGIFSVLRRVLNEK